MNEEEAKELRRRAEAVREGGFDNVPEMSADEVQRLVSELRTHQIELELQNEELRRAQIELIDARDRYSDLYDFAPIGYVSINEKGLIVGANLRLADMLGVDRGDLALQRFSLFVFEEDQDVYYRHHRQMCHSGEPLTSELRLKQADGSPIWTELSSIATTDNAETEYRTSVTDVKTRRQLAEQARQVEKMQAVGQLAGGIAHDFNNMLGGIVTYISLAETKLESEHAAGTYLHKAEDACFRATELTQRLLAFAKGGGTAAEPLAVSEIARAAADLALSGSNVRAEFDEPEEACWIKGDQGQIHQALLNLLVNARQAMPEGGTVTLRIETVDLSAAEVSTIEPGSFVKVSVIDSGVGIPADELSRIFEPFYTTKQGGSGLGLATCFTVIAQHGGMTAVESEMGVGATFAIFLPACEKPVNTETETSTQERRAAGHGRILYMDDEESLRVTTQAWLGSRGYDVETAADGDTALALYENAMAISQPFDVVILDLTIRDGMGGAETMENLLAIDPAVKAIVVSGYSDDMVMAEHVDLGFKAALTKPLPLRDLPLRIDDIIASQH